MFNFTGNTRKSRTVNLGGRKATTSASSSANSAARAAQEKRAAREKERKRNAAAESIQSLWRGRRVADKQRQEWRQEWDSLAQEDSLDEERLSTLLTLFLAFFHRGFRERKIASRRWEKDDLDRLSILVGAVKQWLEGGYVGKDEKRMQYLLGQFSRLLILSIDAGIFSGDLLEDALATLPMLMERLPELVDDEYYAALEKYTVSGTDWTDKLLTAVIAPLHYADRNQKFANSIYSSYAAQFLSASSLSARLWSADYERLRNGVDINRLTASLLNRPVWENMDDEGRLWLLSHVIDIARHGQNAINLAGGRTLSEKNYITVLSLLLSSVAVEVGQRIEVEDVSMGHESDSEDEFDSTRKKRKEPLPGFVKTQIMSLLKQSSVSSMLNNTKSTDPEAEILAGFALTLLLVFPARRQDIRVWLCLAETSDGVSAMRFFWKAVKNSSLFNEIKEDLNIVVERMKLPPTSRKIEDEWNLILLFLEIYSFSLSVTDDTEFLSGAVRQLPLEDVKEMTLFLKNLAFALYYHTGDIMGEDKTRDTGGEVFFDPPESRRGWDVKQFRGAVTTVLRMIYTRDSRRHFLPKDHWLMTDKVSIEGFIPSVVREEENRQRQLEEDSEGDDEMRLEVDPEALRAMSPFERNNMRIARLQRQQHRNRKMNYLATIAPRLEILQHLPFFIPFATRVQIFREFVNTDQMRRRGGHTDPDLWWATQRGPALDGRKHRATIRRGNEFDDAYQQFWTLGEGLKEPIQIKFVDRFGADEAGIDGGGVTKEFLTAVCKEAFSPADNEDEDDDRSDNGLNEVTNVKNLFRENSQHLLYPNPTSIEELKVQLDASRVSDPKFRKSRIEDLLNRYEFMGRILGKCLYEGILVDIAFAPFFLLKWAHPESQNLSSIVGVNDLKDLDSDLYRGLVQLRNYEGNVEDFGLTFSVDTAIPGSKKVITVPLKPNGEDILVTNQTRLEYIHLISRYRLSIESWAQTTSFLRGLNSIIKPSWLSMFNQSELQTLVGGDANTMIDVDDLRRNTIYGGVYVVGDDGREHETIELFWRVMKELSDEERRKVLRFVTSVSRPPLLGFGALKPRFSIRDAGDDQGRLCSASTCVNLLKMPRYTDPAVLKQKLLYSVNSGAGFDLS